jgi:hypothetical protein
LARTLFKDSRTLSAHQPERIRQSIDSNSLTTNEITNVGRELCKPLVVQKIESSDFEPVAVSGEETELGKTIAAITEDVERWAEGARQGVADKYAGQIAFARKHLSRYQVAGAVRAINESRNAELALIKQAAAKERAGRIETAIRLFRGKFDNRRKPPAKPNCP